MQAGMKHSMPDTQAAFDRMAASIKDSRGQKEEIVAAMKNAVAERDAVQAKLTKLENAMGAWGKRW